MNKKVNGILGTLLSIIILIYFESTMYKIISVLGINISNYSSIIQSIVNIVIKGLMCFIIYFIYKKDFKKRYKENNIIRSSIFLFIYVLILVLLMYAFRYVIGFIGDIFDVKILEEEFYNIFNKTLDINLVIKIISDYLIIPFLYCSIILLGTNKLCKHNQTFYIISGLIASIIYSFKLSGTLGYVILNSLPMFILFIFLSIIYKRENSILLTIFLYGLYLISNSIIINYLGW